VVCGKPGGASKTEHMHAKLKGEEKKTNTTHPTKKTTKKKQRQPKREVKVDKNRGCQGIRVGRCRGDETKGGIRRPRTETRTPKGNERERAKDAGVRK